ncbi:MAG: phage protease, partial [Pseudomonadota bacterium]
GREGAIWGQVEWTAAGAQAVASRAYRYISPVFVLETKSGEVLRITSAGLTNQPALELQALARREAGDDADPDPAKETPMPTPAICRALDLQEEAAEASVLTAIEALKTSTAQARAEAATPPLDKFVPRADHETALARVKELEAADADRAAKAIEDEVDAAVKAGKITPGSRDYHVAACKAADGLDHFRAYVASAPEVGGKSGLDGKDPKDAKGAGAHGLTDEEKATCRAAGWSFEDFAKAKADEAKETV